MSNEEILGQVEETDSANPLLSMDINELRKYCKIFSIPSQRDWKKEDFLGAIRDKLKQVELVTAAQAQRDINAPKAGHSRILVHKDPSATASNRSIVVAVNGRIFQIPRGIEVEVPNPIVEALRNSKTHTTVQTNANARTMAEETYEHVESTAYPYTIIAVSDGEYVNPNDQRAKTYRLREQFLEKYGKWPTQAELNEAIAHGRVDALVKGR